MKWGNASTCLFNRIFYKSGLWLTRGQAEAAAKGIWDSLEPCLDSDGSCFCSEEAYGAAAKLSALKGWKLYYLRPKCHMMAHIAFHGCRDLSMGVCAKVTARGRAGDAVPVRVEPGGNVLLGGRGFHRQNLTNFKKSPHDPSSNRDFEKGFGSLQD